MKFNADFIVSGKKYDFSACVIFYKEFETEKKIKSAYLTATSLGNYEARINSKRVSDYVLAPGWTQVAKRLQYQTYDVTDMLKKKNKLEIEVGNGWYRGRMAALRPGQEDLPVAVAAELLITYGDGTAEKITTDETWKTKRSNILYSDCFNGETWDFNYVDRRAVPCKKIKWDKKILIPQEGEKICEHERIRPSLITAANGDKILDFGQNMTGYVKISVNAKKGDRYVLECAEILDKDGNFFNGNYRSAKARMEFICKDGLNVFKPKFAFYGFRYLRLTECPKGGIDPNNFEGICVYSDIKKTGYLNCSNEKLNKLFDNIFWGQKDNYLDVPTDCPQRDERKGWTGDAQVFAHAASFNFDVLKFFKKWMHDVSAASMDGRVPKLVPARWEDASVLDEGLLSNSSAWGDAILICPWQMYLTYGDTEILKDNFDTMKGWVDYMGRVTKDKYMFTGHFQFGDWLGLDAPEGSLAGSTRKDFIGTAFYAYSTSLLIKIGKILSHDMKEYEKLYKNIKKQFIKAFGENYETQTECALALYFDLTADKKKTAERLASLVRDCGMHLMTGFVGTPYLLHALSENGYQDIAYSLLLREEFPSWLYSVNAGATTIWEHWDGQKTDGSLWYSTTGQCVDMNSFNHYAYGAVADWVYGYAAGIKRCEEAPGFEKAVIEPHPDKRLGHLTASVETRRGKISSKWSYTNDGIRYDITTPCETEIILGDKHYHVEAGDYIFYER